MSLIELVPEGVAYPPKFGSPTALGVRAGDFIFISGMIAWDVNRRIVGVGDPHAQTLQALRNMQDTLEEGGASLRDVVRITFYLTDIREKPRVWEARKELFGDARPASTLVEVSHLVDPQALLEIDAIAYCPVVGCKE
ncbi:MAG: RidA family protein [Betaproteobacteria bacterium]|nr:RidA family protein [Betaproteobacteria bacterium]